MDTPTDLDRLRQAILADRALQAELGALDAKDFALRALAKAARLGLAVTGEELAQSLRPDPIGMARWMESPLTPGRPAAGWLPIHVSPSPHFPVDWAWFGDMPLREAMFEDSIREAMVRPLNRFCRFRTPLADLAATAEALPVLPPAGFIFHMSRCGSTLATQMLSADPDNLVLSEPSPFDFALRLDQMLQLPEELHVSVLRAMLGALGQRRRAREQWLLVKLDSWHTRQMPLLARAFPDVPWIFMYREPVEVLASQVLERGMQTVPEFMPPQVYGLTDDDAMLPPDEYCARVLAQVCAPVVANAAGGLLVNYKEMPQAVWTRILPHFAVRPAAEGLAAIRDAARFDSKRGGGVPFTGREDTKREAMTDALRVLADRHIGPVYTALEALRLGRG